VDSYPERWRDWPDEARQLAYLFRCCANSCRQ